MYKNPKKSGKLVTKILQIWEKIWNQYLKIGKKITFNERSEQPPEALQGDPKTDLYSFKRNFSLHSFFFSLFILWNFAIIGRLYRVIHGFPSSFRDSVLKWG